jgi:hypothetical protein
MASLAETNPYLRDPEMRRRMLEEDALDSSVFEGARGLKPLAPLKETYKRRCIASKKKPARES